MLLQRHLQKQDGTSFWSLEVKRLFSLFLLNSLPAVSVSSFKPLISRIRQLLLPDSRICSVRD